MAKVRVLDEGEDTHVPFLRGILTRSLQDAGLAFEDAYAIASEVRDTLDTREDISALDLRTLVGELLVDKGLQATAEQYTTPRNERVSILVRSGQGSLSPFSKSELVQSLEICAQPHETLYGVAAAVERELQGEAIVEIDSETLVRTTLRHLIDAVGERVSRRFLRWEEFLDTGRPLILLIGGVTGSGKSTMSSLVSNRLGIIRTQSTDMLREVMRRMVPSRLIPSLHESSFTAYRALPRWGQDDGTMVEPHMVDGYLMQAEEVGVGIEGVFSRALRERVSLVIEGVHLHPRMQREFAKNEEAVVVPVILGTLKRKSLRRKLFGRGLSTTSRRAERYLDNFEQIWQLQTFLLSQADQHDVAIITEREPDEMVRQIMRVVADRLTEEFEGDPSNYGINAETAPVSGVEGVATNASGAESDQP